MTELYYSGLKYGENDLEVKLLVDIQNDWFDSYAYQGSVSSNE